MKRARKKSKNEMLENRIILALAVIICGLSVFIGVKLSGRDEGSYHIEEKACSEAADSAETDTGDFGDAPENGVLKLGTEYRSYIYGVD